MGGNASDDDQMDIRVVGQGADGEVDVLVVSDRSERQKDFLAPRNLPIRPDGLGVLMDG